MNKYKEALHFLKVHTDSNLSLAFSGDIKTYSDMKDKANKNVATIEEAIKKAQAIDIISQNFRLVGNCLHAKNEYAEDGWVFVKELIDEEELEAWKEILEKGDK